MSRRVYIETVGCQMNVLDSELLAARLEEAGCRMVPSRSDADTILFNTCSVRQHAEDKIYSALGRLKHLKDQRPGTIIGVLGCMAQRASRDILRRAPHVDLVVGPGRLGQLDELIARIEEGEGPLVEISGQRRGNKQAEVARSFAQFDGPRKTELRPGAHQAHVRIMFGCDQFCTYCIVPSVRGPEQSRPVEAVVDEVRRLADQGCQEVTLLGQAVNRYADRSEGEARDLADLLRRLDVIDGLHRIRFVTNHPRYMTDRLIAAVAELPRVCPYFHVPAQHGAEAVLRRMNRGYTVEEYRRLVERIRAAVPQGDGPLGAAITSDFIVGFCGETEEDFQRTVDLVRWARFKNSYIFKYSPRVGTKAAERFADDVPEAEKRRRNNELLDVQNQVSLEDNRRLVGCRLEVLVEGPSKAARKLDTRTQGGGEEGGADSSGPPDARGQLVGRTAGDRIVVFPGPTSLTGRIIPVKIEKADACTLFGGVEEGGSSREGLQENPDDNSRI